jgi:hypothetical protein
VPPPLPLPLLPPLLLELTPHALGQLCDAQLATLLRHVVHAGDSCCWQPVRQAVSFCAHGHKQLK